VERQAEDSPAVDLAGADADGDRDRESVEAEGEGQGDDVYQVDRGLLKLFNIVCRPRLWQVRLSVRQLPDGSLDRPLGVLGRRKAAPCA
jgi:hypothetical protein